MICQPPNCGFMACYSQGIVQIGTTGNVLSVGSTQNLHSQQRKGMVQQVRLCLAPSGDKRRQSSTPRLSFRMFTAREDLRAVFLDWMIVVDLAPLSGLLNRLATNATARRQAIA